MPTFDEYEDMILANRAKEAEKEWILGGCNTASHEELCRELGIESNIVKSAFRKVMKKNHNLLKRLADK